MPVNNIVIDSHSKPKTFFPVWLSLLAILLWWIIVDLELDFETLLWGLRDMGEYFSRYGSPNFTNIHYYFDLILQTLATAFWATFLAILAALFLAPFAARNLSPHPVLYRLAREILNFMRAMPDLLLALLFVAAIGLGPLAGVLALAIHTAGFLGKFFAESLERVDAGVYEAMDSMGANFFQTIMFAGLPSIRLELIGYTLYIIDRNVRAATVLGLVGAGGIGLELHEALSLFNYDKASAIIILVVVVIVIIDHLASYIRHQLR